MNVIELLVGVVLALGAVWYVMGPVLRPALAGSSRSAGVADSATDAEDDLSPRAVALRALKEIEFDRATGKLDDADYEDLKRRYTAEALDALRREEGRGTGEGSVATAAAGSRLPAPGSPSCPIHGPAAEPDAVFCPACGRRLAGGAGFCARCGTALEAGASFCNSCGGRVAA